MRDVSREQSAARPRGPRRLHRLSEAHDNGAPVALPMYQRKHSILDHTRPHASFTTSHAALEPTLACIASLNAWLQHAGGIAIDGDSACRRERWEDPADVSPRR